MTIWDKANNFNRCWTSTTYQKIVLSCIIGNRNLLNTMSRSIRRSQTLYWNRPLLLDVCGYMIFCFGLVHLTSWIKIPTVVDLLMRLDLGLPLILFSSWNIYYSTTFNIITIRRSFPESRSNLTAGLDLLIIVMMPLTTGSWYITKLHWPDLQSSQQMIQATWIILWIYYFLMRDRRSKFNPSPRRSIPGYHTPFTVNKTSPSALSSRLSIHWTSWVTSLWTITAAPRNVRRKRSSWRRKENPWWQVMNELHWPHKYLQL